jgi:hypothetical protein
LIHRASTQNKLLQLENEGLLTSLDTKNKRTRHGKRLLLRGTKKQPTDAVFCSPRKLREAKAIQAEKDREEEDEKLQKRAREGKGAANSLKKKQEAEGRRTERARKKRVKEKERADKEAEKQRKEEDKDREKTLKLRKRVCAKLQKDYASSRVVRSLVVVVR